MLYLEGTESEHSQAHLLWDPDSHLITGPAVPRGSLSRSVSPEPNTPHIKLIASESTKTTKVLEIDGSMLVLQQTLINLALYKYYNGSSKNSTYYRCWNGKQNAKVCSATCFISESGISDVKHHTCQGTEWLHNIFYLC